VHTHQLAQPPELLKKIVEINPKIYNTDLTHVADSNLEFNNDKIGLRSKLGASSTSVLAVSAIITKEEKLKIAREELVKLDKESNHIIQNVYPESG
jgi:hypothetical protein